jgi:cytochrome P450
VLTLASDRGVRTIDKTGVFTLSDRRWRMTNTSGRNRTQTVAGEAAEVMQSSAVPPEEPVFDPFAPGYFADPYPHYEVLRDRHPVYFEERVATYLVTRYADVHRLARDRSMMVAADRATPTPRIMAEIARNAAVDIGTDRFLVFRDGDDHARLRRLLSQAFTPAVVAAWRARTEAIVDGLLTAAEGHDPFDAITDFARPLPAQIISEMLGVPKGDMPQLLDWSHDLFRTIESFNTPQEDQAIVTATRAMAAYLTELLADKRARPGDDVLTALLAASDSDGRLSTDEIIAQVVMLYVAGHETTGSLIANGLVHLFAHPAERARLVDDPGLDAGAIQEMLRYDAPIQFTRRIPVDAFELHGTSIPAGADVLLCLGSANRDPRKWGDDADSLDLRRPNAGDHMSFGGGSHYCLGASLARLEAQIALPGVLRRFPELAPAYDEPTWSTRMVLRGVETLPVHLTGA